MSQLVFGSAEAEEQRKKDQVMNALVTCPTCHDDTWKNICLDCDGTEQVQGFHALRLLKRPAFSDAKDKFLNTMPSSIAAVLRTLLNRDN